MTVMYRWPLWTSGRYDRFYCISKILQAIVHDGCPSQLASKKLRGANINVNNYLCEYSTNF